MEWPALRNVFYARITVVDNVIVVMMEISPSKSGPLSSESWFLASISVIRESSFFDWKSLTTVAFPTDCQLLRLERVAFRGSGDIPLGC
jgi:hypothetical protein